MIFGMMALFMSMVFAATRVLMENTLRAYEKESVPLAESFSPV
jgi:hypothetical protein